ncbi:DUF357 domain-containing protein [Caldiplasma sukawensis]
MNLEEKLTEKVQKYIEIERKALEAISILPDNGTFLSDFGKNAMEMITAYYNDAIHFKESGDLINALSALNYSYGWIDCCARLGIIRTDRDGEKFTL